MAGNTPNVAPNHIQDTAHEQIQENTRIAEIKNTVSHKLDRLCDTIKGCVASGALALTLAATPVNAQPTNAREVTMETVVVIEGKEYTYGTLYAMSSQNRQVILDKITNLRERVRVKNDLLNFRQESVRQAVTENQQARAENQQSRELNQLITIVSDKTRPIAERRQAFDQFQEGVRKSTVFTEEQKQSYYAQFPMIAQMLNR